MDIVKDQINQINHAYESYNYWLKHSDPRVADWFLMDSFTPTICLCAAYLLMVKIGPQIMAKRKEPFQLQMPMVLYNFFVVALNIHIVKEAIIAGYINLKYNMLCQSVNYSYDPNEMRIASALYWYYISKLIEMMDTVFFILRKKNNQLSFLHVYHHVSMLFLWWIGIKWVAGGQSLFGALVNSSIHIIMYTYYGVSALGKQYQKYLWWKKYMTQLQLLQFFVGLVHAGQSIYFECDFPLWMHWCFLGYATSITMFFLNYYLHEYIKKTNAAKRAKLNAVQGQNGISEKNGVAAATNGKAATSSNGDATSNGNYSNGETKKGK